ncbi:DUF4365 domain-containing protein [Pseudarthrobacter cellobiosi]|uniref:DUF4365 domain-containing protein n=1 Tax=Pseudarthrobacter cellobiosi TaxID=2953654 RepID=UPI00208EEC03|nr:DUF4365 domain-containing protein [Pseudarthrobacter sp. HLT1-5]MCO4253886.1 DUF4365 domain-containing protein [Pseudarthrobacter sp. HLT1-5]
MVGELPGTPGNMKSSAEALALLEKALRTMEVYHFPWPQDVDSGIDLVGFATLTREDGDKRGAATAFVAGFQSKGTDDYFTDNQARSVQIEQHEEYWKSATLPVFVARISNDGAALLVEDALSSLHGLALIAPYEDRIKSIPTTVTIQSAATDIRLRMFAHALAPWISQRLRARTLAHEDEFRGLNRQSAWSLLDYTAGRYSALPVPGSWADVQQYFTLVDYMYADWTFRQQLFQDLKNRVSAGPDDQEYGWDDQEYGWDDEPLLVGAKRSANSLRTGAFRLLGGMIELLLRFESRLSTLTAEPMPGQQSLKAYRARLAAYREEDSKENLHALKKAEEAHERPKEALARKDVEEAVRVITEVWEGAATALGYTQNELAAAASLYGGNFSPSSQTFYEILSRTDDVQTALQGALYTWAAKSFYVRHWDSAARAVDELPPSMR